MAPTSGAALEEHWRDELAELGFRAPRSGFECSIESSPRLGRSSEPCRDRPGQPEQPEDHSAAEHRYESEVDQLWSVGDIAYSWCGRSVGVSG